MTARVKIDVSVLVTVWVCWCGTRGLANDRHEALRSARHHELRAHPGSRQALDTLRKYEARRAP